MSHTAVMTLTEFLTARLDEDDAAADLWEREGAVVAMRADHVPDIYVEQPWIRAWAEVAAKRRIVSRCDMVLRGREHDMFGEGQATDARDNLRSLASVYADHPDYDPGWGV